jgi:hypothetical protein
MRTANTTIMIINRTPPPAAIPASHYIVVDHQIPSYVPAISPTFDGESVGLLVGEGDGAIFVASEPAVKLVRW